MTEGLPLYSPAPPTQRQPPDPDPDPVETELGAAGARTETSLATRGIIRARLSCPKNYSEGNRNSSESQSRDPGDPPQSSPPPLPGRTPTHKAGNLATPPQKQAEPAPRGRGAVGSGRVGWGGTPGLGWAAWPGPNCHLSEGLVQLRRGRQIFGVYFSFFFTILCQFQLIRSN